MGPGARTARRGGDEGVAAGRGPTVAAVAGAGAVNAVCLLPLFLTAALAVQLRAELGFGPAALGVAVATFLGAAAAASVPLGRLAQRVGPGRGLRVAAAVSAVCTLGIAATAGSLATLLPWLALAGTALSLGESSGNLSLAERVRGERLGLAFGFKQSASPVASLAAGLAVPFVALTIGWRAAFVGAAGLAVLAAVLLASGPPVASRTAHRPSPGRGRGLLLLTIAGGSGFAAATALSTFIVDAAVTGGVPAGGAGLLLAVASLAAVGARLVLGAVADRRSDRQFGVVAAMMALGTVGYVLLAVGGTPLTVAGALVAYGLGYGWSGLFFFSVARLDPVGAGSASGVVLTGGFLGSLLGPLVVGGLAERWSYSAGWIACACAMVLAAFATLVVHRRQTRRVPAAL